MKNILRSFLLKAIALTGCLFLFSRPLFADVTLTTAPIAAANIGQGSTGVIAYAVKMDVTISPVTVSNIQFTLGGSYDNNDLSLVSVYFNAAAPTVSGATLLTNLSGAFTAPHIFSASISRAMAAGSSGYFIITFDLSPTATAGNTVKADGLANPAVFSFLTSPTVINNQTDLAGIQTIISGAVTLTSSAVAASNIVQGASTTIAYIAKMDVTGLPVTVNNIQFTLGGTYDNNDLSLVSVYFNAATPTVSGATLLSNIGGGFTAPHIFSTSLSKTMAAGSSGYFIITFDLSPTATAGNTVKADGLVNPAVFSFLTGPTVTNNQTDVAGVQTFIGGAVTLTSSAVAASNIVQGASTTIAYIAKMDVTGLPVTVNNIQFTLGGTYDNNDLSLVSVYFNAATPTVSGATLLSNIGGGFTAPHIFSTSLSKTMAAGSSGYFIITFDLSPTATAGNTVKADGLVNPAVFSFLTGPTVTNNQTDVAGVQTFTGGTVTLTSSPVAASNIAQGASTTIAYIAKMDVTGLPVTVNNIQFTLGGTYDNNDLSLVSVYFNAATPTVSGATLLSNIGGGFTAPHIFSTSLSKTMAAGSSGYFIITFDLSPTATAGNTVKADGLANPAVFSFLTGPTVTNNQTDVAGVQTFTGGTVTLTSSPVAASNIAQGTSNTIAYIVKMDVTGLPVTVNNLQVTLSGTHDNNDLVTMGAWFNGTTPSLSGATNLNNISATFAAPHTYNISFGQAIASGGSGYFIVTFTLSASATAGNIIKVDGLTNPAVFSFLTGPTVTNNQTDAAGVQTILAAGVTLSSSAVSAAHILPGSNNNLVYAVKMGVTNLPVTANNIQCTLTGTYDNDDVTSVGIWFNSTASTLSGAVNLNNTSGLFAAPHTYNIPIGQTISAGGTGYYIITVNLSATATIGNTINLDGAANPVVFSFTTAPPLTNNQSNSAGVQTFSTTLPLTLTSFTVNSSNAKQAFLTWSTAGEINTRIFELEWSNDGLHFNTIATIAAAGNSTLNKQYSYVHNNPVEGNNFYRLKMLDNNNRFAYSWVIKIRFAAATNAITVFPNPVADMLQITLQSDKNTNMPGSLKSADGKLIAVKNFTVVKGSNSLNWNLQQLAPGIYFISFTNDNYETVRIVKR